MDSLQVLQTTVQVLSVSQRVSAATFNTFLIIHLSAPIAAAFAPVGLGQPESKASGLMLLGRVYYQGEWSEAIVVWGSLAVHIASGVLGRVAKSFERKERRRRRKIEVLRDAKAHEMEEEELGQLAQDPPPDEPAEDSVVAPEQDVGEARPAPAKSATSFLGPFSWVHRSGYVLVPLLLPHIGIHRLIPAKLSLSPTLFSFSFVAFSLSDSSRRVRSALSYSALVSIAVYHALSGMRVMLDPVAPRGLAPRRRKAGTSPSVTQRGWQAGYSSIVLAVGIGLARLAGDGPAVPAWLANKYSAL